MSLVHCPECGHLVHPVYDEAVSPVLDVPLLGESIMRHDANDSWPAEFQVAHDRGHCGNFYCATAIAAEYARLAAEEQGS